MLTFILYYTFPSKPYFVAPSVIMAKCYSNSLLAIFNSRIHVIGGRMSQNDDAHISFGNFQRATDPTDPRAASNMTVQIQEEVYVHSDALQLEILQSQVRRSSFYHS